MPFSYRNSMKAGGHMNKLTIKTVLIFGLVLGDVWVLSQKESKLRIPASVTSSAKTFVFNYKDLSKKPFQIKKEAISYEDAYRQASKDCFQRLTHGEYPGEEKGLDIIDICANPKS